MERRHHRGRIAGQEAGVGGGAFTDNRDDLRGAFGGVAIGLGGVRDRLRQFVIGIRGRRAVGGQRENAAFEHFGHRQHRGPVERMKGGVGDIIIRCEQRRRIGPM